MRKRQPNLDRLNSMEHIDYFITELARERKPNLDQLNKVVHVLAEKKNNIKNNYATDSLQAWRQQLAQLENSTMFVKILQRTKSVVHYYGSLCLKFAFSKP